VLADQAAARQLGDPNVLHQALRTLAADSPGQGGIDAETRARIARSSVGQSRRRPLVDATVRLMTLALGALLLASICLSIHASSAWLGVIACLFFVAGFVTLTRPALKRKKSLGKPHEIPHA
jgi:general stress protein CsbA